MGACATKPNVLKEEGNAPLTREVEPAEILAAESDSVGGVVEVAAAVDVKEAETSGAGGGEGDNSRQSLEVLLKAVEVKAPFSSTEPTRTEEQPPPQERVVIDEKAAIVVQTKEAKKSAPEVDSRAPIAAAEPPKTSGKPEPKSADSVVTAEKTTDVDAKPAETVDKPTAVAEPKKKAPEEPKFDKVAAVAEHPVETKAAAAAPGASPAAVAVDAKQEQTAEKKGEANVAATATSK